MKRITLVFLSLLLALFAILLNSCDKYDVSEDKINIATTLFINYDIARAVAGDRAQISLLLPPGAQSHDFDPTPGTLLTLGGADMILHGGKLDNIGVRMLTQVNSNKTVAVDMSNNITLLSYEGDSHSHSDYDLDGHYWTSPKNVITMVDTFLRAIIELDPDSEEYYRENAQKYILEVSEIDSVFDQMFSDAEDFVLVVASQFPFLYFCNEYDIDYIAAYDTCAEHSEPSSRRMAEIIDTVRDKSIGAVYFKELSSTAAAETVCGATGAQMYLLHSAHNISSEDFESGVTYPELMRQNISNLSRGICK